MYAFKKSRLQNLWGFPHGSDSEESACNAGDTGYNPGSGRFPLRRTHSSIPGEFCAQRSPVGYSPWGHKRSDMTEQLTLSLSQKLYMHIW